MTTKMKPKAKVCNLPKEQANSYRGYAAHKRRGENPCEGCTAAASKEKGESNNRRAAIRREVLSIFREEHTEIYGEAMEAAEAKYPKKDA